MKIMQYFPGIMIIVSALILSGQSLARGNHQGGEVVVDIVSDQRGLLPRFDAPFAEVAEERSYVIARDAERYSIRVTNRSGRRVGVVLAVDGRNIISGEKSYLQSHEPMYILGPHQTQEVAGWRSGRNQINRFYFTGMSDSYAAAWGDHTAMGVVAAAVFREHQPQTYGNEKRYKKSGKSQAMREAPGTGYGEHEWSPGREVHFVAQKRAFEKKFIKYEWRSTLCRMGIVQCGPDRDQNRFWPQGRRNHGYAPPPPSWSFQLRF
ncbi:MAG: hypothetical protein KJ804_05090 [Proteobacteria bacterium]|nr:hypothetical protein [Pseudomonadota bacterium]MBU1057679.1 hypothetical protein [Pseudomonadota bacterium]